MLTPKQTEALLLVEEGRPWLGVSERNKQLGRLRSLDSLVRRGLIARERNQVRLGASYTLTDVGRRKAEAIRGLLREGQPDIVRP